VPAADAAPASTNPGPVLCDGTPITGQDCVTQAFAPTTTFATQMMAFAPQNVGLQSGRP
jgi:hypothetical protein